VQDHTDDDRAEALKNVYYELWMMAEASSRIRSGGLAGDDVAANAFLEAMLLHARATTDFFVMTRGYQSDIRRTDFAPEWNPEPIGAVARIRAYVGLIDKHLAHLTWERLDSASPAWDYYNIADDILAVADRWSVHLRSSDPGLDAIFRPLVVSAQNALN
jgi:hypothetical protein